MSTLYESQTTSPSESAGSSQAGFSDHQAKISRYLVVGSIEIDDPARSAITMEEAQRIAAELTTKYNEHNVGFAVIQFIEIGRYEPARPIWVTP